MKKHFRTICNSDYKVREVLGGWLVTTLHGAPVAKYCRNGESYYGWNGVKFLRAEAVYPTLNSFLAVYRLGMFTDYCPENGWIIDI